MKLPVHAVAIILLVAAGAGLPAAAQTQCPPPPNPNAGGCSLAIDNSVLQEADANLDGQPDNRGSTGSFCGGNSGADCIGVIAAEVGFDLIITDPARQSVTCTLPGIEVWIMPIGCGSCLARGLGSVTLPAGSTTASTVKVVVADVNGDICPCGPALTCAFSREVLCGDGVDGDGDGLIDAADPDCCIDADSDGFCGAADCDDADPLVHTPPVEVEGVRLTVGSAGNTRVTWEEQPGAVVDILSGLLSGLDDGFTQAYCQSNNRSGSVYTDFQPRPPAGDGYFFLMRAQNSCGESSYGSGPALDAGSPCP